MAGTMKPELTEPEFRAYIANLKGDASRICGVTRARISQIVNNRNGQMTVGISERIAKALGYERVVVFRKLGE